MRPGRGAPRAPEPPKPKAKRLQPGRVYRDAVLAELSPERKAVAEQILRGGIPAVRQAVEEQNAQAREVGGPEIKADALLAVAEELLPALKAAEWRDRAEAAVVVVDEISVRDLRAVVSGADTARDEEGRSLAAQLREALDRRAAAERQTWVDAIGSSLDDGRVVRALRISGRPPEPGLRFPAELAERLSDASGEALGPDTTPDRWAAVLEAVVASPIRRTITPRGLPPEPGEALTKALRLAAPRVPAIAALLGEAPGAPPRRPARPATPRGGPGLGPGVGAGRPPGRPSTPPPGRPVPTSHPAAEAAGAGVELAKAAPENAEASSDEPAPTPHSNVPADDADGPAPAPEPVDAAAPDESAAAAESDTEPTADVVEPAPATAAAADADSTPTSVDDVGEAETSVTETGAPAPEDALVPIPGGDPAERRYEVPQEGSTADDEPPAASVSVSAGDGVGDDTNPSA